MIPAAQAMVSLAAYFNRPKLTWVIPDQVAALSQPSSRDLPRLRRMGVTLLVSIVSTPFPRDDIARAQLNYLHLPVMYLRAPRPEQIQRFVEAVEAELAAGGKVAVHCVGGIGRTGTAIACYLVERGLSAYEALDVVRAARPGSVESAEQERAIIAWANRKAAREATPEPASSDLAVEHIPIVPGPVVAFPLEEREISMTRVAQAGYLRWHRDGTGVDVRTLSTGTGDSPMIEQLKAALTELETSNGTTVTLTETLGKGGESWVSISCEPGQQGDLLVTAGRIVNLLVGAKVYEEVQLSSE